MLNKDIFCNDQKGCQAFGSLLGAYLDALKYNFTHRPIIFIFKTYIFENLFLCLVYGARVYGVWFYVLPKTKQVCKIIFVRDMQTVHQREQLESKKMIYQMRCLFEPSDKQISQFIIKMLEILSNTSRRSKIDRPRNSPT